MKAYQSPKFEKVLFLEQDVVTASTENGLVVGGDGGTGSNDLPIEW